MSKIAWLDYDGAAREKTLQLLSAFQEKESVDELGLGTLTYFQRNGVTFLNGFTCRLSLPEDNAFFILVIILICNIKLKLISVILLNLNNIHSNKVRQ